MKNVLMITHAFPPAAGSGVFRSLKFAHYLPDFGFLPVILSTRDCYHEKKDASLAKTISEEVPVYKTALWDALSLYRWLKSVARPNPKPESLPTDGPDRRIVTKKGGALYRLRKRVLEWMTFPDQWNGWLIPGLLKGIRVVHTHTPELIYATSPARSALLIGCLLKRFTGKPLVIDFRDPWALNGGREKEIRGKFLVRVDQWLERRVMRCADRVIMNTQAMAQAYGAVYGEFLKAKMRVITNGYDEADFSGLGRCKRDSRFTLAHVGEFYRTLRRPDLVLQSFQELISEGAIPLSGVRIQFVGGGEWVLTGEFNRMLHRFGLETVVETTPHLTHRESLQYMMNADALLLLQPSPVTQNQIPAKAFEYIRTGQYILTVAPAGATADITILAGAGTVVAPDDRDSMKKTLLSLFEQYRTGQIPVREEKQTLAFSRRNLTRDLAGIFEDLLSGRKNR